MNNTVIFYFSSHHNNTKDLVSGLPGADIFPVNQAAEAELSQYRLVGFASGIYMGKPHPSLLELARKIARERQGDLPQVFAVCTSGSGGKSYSKRFQAQLEKLGLPVAGAYSCKGFDTFGPWKLVGGIAKGHPDQRDRENLENFLQKLREGTNSHDSGGQKSSQNPGIN